MAVNNDGARFPCLAMARYMVATVVTVFAVVVIVMVITVDVLRPEKISVSVLHGHVQVTDLWQAVVHGPSSETDVKYEPVQPRRQHFHRASAKAADDTAAADLWKAVPVPVGTTLARRPETSAETDIAADVEYKPAKYVSFGLTLGADNPSGRANIHCKNVTVRFLDMAYYGRGDFTGMMELGNISMPNMSFLVEKKSTHWLRRWQSIEDRNVLYHLAKTYAGSRSFTGAVHVSMSISSDTLVGPTTTYRYVDHYCSPLTVSVDEPSDTARDVTCV